MFTGIIQHVGTIESVQPGAQATRLVVDLGPVSAKVKPGDSVAVDGVCLTVAELHGARAGFDAVAETLSRTTLETFRPGCLVNLEPALGAGDPLGGHFVTGHVDGLAVYDRRREAAQTYEVFFRGPPELVGQLVSKGSVAVDGVSLTVVAAEADEFSVALVPFTLSHTTLGHRRPGDRVNIETDLLGKYVRRSLGIVSASPINEQRLRDAGFC